MSLIVPRYNYVKIDRTTVDGKRLYTTPGGNKVPSVTTVLAATQSKEKQQSLNEWRNAVGHARANAITKQAANRGTRMHTFLESYINTGALPERPGNPYAWASYVMAENLINKGMPKVNEIWGTEVPLYMPRMYAGTSDMTGVHDGAQAIFDHKQSNKPKTDDRVEDYKLQVVAYAAAHNELYQTTIRKGVIFISIKPITDQDGLLIEDKPTWKDEDFQEIIVEGEQFDYWLNKWWDRLEQYYLCL